jgi:hypothetical protein
MSPTVAACHPLAIQMADAALGRAVGAILGIALLPFNSRKGEHEVRP